MGSFLSMKTCDSADHITMKLALEIGTMEGFSIIFLVIVVYFVDNSHLVEKMLSCYKIAVLI